MAAIRLAARAETVTGIVHGHGTLAAVSDRLLCSPRHGIAKGQIPADPAAAGRICWGPLSARPGRWPPMPPGRQTAGAAFIPERESATRTCYSRDRDRIIHSTRLPPPQAQDPGLCAA